MSETKWTPGPWEAWRLGRNRNAWGISNEALATRIAETALWANIDSHGESKANAHLIAAAPDLYEALEQCRSELKSILLQYDNTTPSYGLDLANNALDKARGETQ